MINLNFLLTSPGNNGISNGKPDKNAGILVDFFVQLNQLGRTVSTADIRRLFHETLHKEGNLGTSAQPLQYGNGGDYEGLYLKLGRFTVDPARTDFIGNIKYNISTIIIIYGIHIKLFI